MFKKGEVSTFKAEKRDRGEREYQTTRKDKREVEKGDGKRKTKIEANAVSTAAKD